MEPEALHREILQRLAKIEATTESGLAEARKTNGRVSSLEKRQDTLEQWRSFMTGGLAVLTCLVVPILIALALRVI